MGWEEAERATVAFLFLVFFLKGVGGKERYYTVPSIIGMQAGILT